MSVSGTIFAGSAALVLVLAVRLAWRNLGVSRMYIPYPPGPAPKPFIGNALDIPSDMPWIKYWEWSKELGSGIIHLSAMGTHIVVLHKMQDVIELMDHRSIIYSGRPWIATNELLGLNSFSSLLPCGREWRTHRVLFHEGFGKKAIPLYYPTFTRKVHLFIHLLLCGPARFKDHCKWLGVAVTMSTTFGYEVAVGKAKDHFVAVAEQILVEAIELTHLGGTLINAIPFLRHIPPWVPGAATQKRAAEAKKLLMKHVNEPFEYVMNNLLAGASKECVSSRLIQRRIMEADGMRIKDQDAIKVAMATTYLAGTETIQVSLLIFFMAMALHPHVQKRAQAEMDSVIGTDRLPTFEDRVLLPYTEAVLRETLRWRLALPLGFPHATTKDDVYKGFFIPKGTLVMANGWAISHDESVYRDSRAFNPDRFFSPDGTLNDDRVDFPFGYGRRICPGRFMAKDVLWMAIASILSTFDISKARDENGVEIEINADAFTTGLASFPQPFECSIVPRSLQAEVHIHSAVAKARE